MNVKRQFLKLDFDQLPPWAFGKSNSLTFPRLLHDYDSDFYSRSRFASSLHRYLTLVWFSCRGGIPRKLRVSPAVVHALARRGILLRSRRALACVFLSPGPERVPCQAGPGRGPASAYLRHLANARASVRACTRERQPGGAVWPGCRLKLLLPTVGHFWAASKTGSQSRGYRPRALPVHAFPFRSTTSIGTRSPEPVVIDSRVFEKNQSSLRGTSFT